MVVSEPCVARARASCKYNLRPNPKQAANVVTLQELQQLFPEDSDDDSSFAGEATSSSEDEEEQEEDAPVVAQPDAQRVDPPPAAKRARR